MTSRIHPQIEEALSRLPENVKDRSGAVFYSGGDAFSKDRPLYILGLNPGGSPTEQSTETIYRDLAAWPDMPSHYSRYIDDSWRAKPPGTHGMQPRLRHMFDCLQMDLRETPASNLVFVRSASEADLSAEKERLISICWPVHQAVIDSQNIETILCLGSTAGRWVREVVGATTLVDSFRESNARGWASEAHLAKDGRAVITVTHPGRADWRNPAADPTPFVRRVLDRR